MLLTWSELWSWLHLATESPSLPSTGSLSTLLAVATTIEDVALERNVRKPAATRAPRAACYQIQLYASLDMTLPTDKRASKTRVRKHAQNNDQVFHVKPMIPMARPMAATTRVAISLLPLGPHATPGQPPRQLSQGRQVGPLRVGSHVSLVNRSRRVRGRRSLRLRREAAILLHFEVQGATRRPTGPPCNGLRTLPLAPLTSVAA